jgi:tetratricopeptide (TPR) repeat protein
MLYQSLFRITVYIFLFLIIACSGENSQSGNLNEKIDYLIEDNRYEEALDLLDDEDQSDLNVQTLREKAHLNYGLHSMNTFDQTEMRTRMNNALRQFTEVLKINPQNDVARNQIEQILQVYSTIPDRQPEDDVIAGLREIGFNI